MEEWSKYKIGNPSAESNWSNPDCLPLTAVYHVTHIEGAYRIIKDGHLLAGLVFDESKLNKERILVNWISPNIWYYGSRYGNVQFVFDFRELIDGRMYYWVEVMRKYSPPALRILITSKDYSEKFKKYNPENPDGPWWYSQENDKHYWNSNYCLEFMIEENLLVENCDDASFVDHHNTYCNIDYRTCPDKGLKKDRAASLLFSKLASENVNMKYFNLGEEEKGVIIPNYHLRSAYSWIVLTLTKDFRSVGSVSSSDDIADSLARSVMFFFANRDLEQSKKVAQLFTNEAELRVTIAKALSRTFNIPDYKNFDIY